MVARLLRILGRNRILMMEHRAWTQLTEFVEDLFFDELLLSFDFLGDGLDPGDVLQWEEKEMSGKKENGNGKKTNEKAINKS